MATKTKRRPAPAPPPRKLPIIPILGGVVGIALVVAIAISIAGSEEARRAEVEIGAPTVSGSLPEFNSEGGDPAVGLAIPTVDTTNFDGDAVSLGPDSGAGGVVFLAHWCPHCQDEVPEIQEWLDSGAQPAAGLYSVATGINPNAANYPPWAWLEREGWTAPVLADDAAQSILRAYGGTSFPFWVFFDDDGNVVGRISGRIGVDALDGFLELAASS